MKTLARRQSLLAYFDEDLAQPCGHCDNCLEPPKQWNATEPARQALSAVYRTGQRYGVGHLIDVLLGRDTERIRSTGHHHLPVFGLGKQLNEHQWRSLFRQLVARSLVDVDLEGYGGLRLSETCRPLLRGETELWLREEPLQVEKTVRSSNATTFIPEYQRPLWERLRGLRRKLADEQCIPPYLIFNDATLLDILDRMPSTLDEMAHVSGIGNVKLERYGKAFLAVLNSSDSTPAVEYSTDIQHEIVTLARHGMTPEQIANQQQCNLKSVYSHLAKAIQSEQIALEQALDFPEELLMEIQDAFLDGDGELPSAKQVAQQFENRFDEGILYCVRASLQLEFG